MPPVCTVQSTNRRPRALRRVLALARAKLWTFINWRRSYYVALLESTLYLVLFGAGFSSAVGALAVAGHTLSYQEFLFAGLVAVASFRVFPYMIFSSSNDVKWGMYIGTSIHDIGTRDLVSTAALLPIVFSSSALYSLDQAPLFLRVLGRLNPLTYQSDSMRHVYVGDWGGGLVNAAVLLGAAVVLIAASYYLMPRMDLTNRQRA